MNEGKKKKKNLLKKKLTEEQEKKLIQASIDGFRKHCNIRKFNPTALQKEKLVTFTNAFLNGLPRDPYPFIRDQDEAMGKALKKGKGFLKALRARDLMILSDIDFIRGAIDSTTKFIKWVEWENRFPIIKSYPRGKRPKIHINDWIDRMAVYYEEATGKRPGRCEGPFSRWLVYLITEAELDLPIDGIVDRIKDL